MGRFEAMVDRVGQLPSTVLASSSAMTPRQCVGRAYDARGIGADWSADVFPGWGFTTCDDCNEYVMGDQLDRLDVDKWVCANNCHWHPCSGGRGVMRRPGAWT